MYKDKTSLEIFRKYVVNLLEKQATFIKMTFMDMFEILKHFRIYSFLIID